MQAFHEKALFFKKKTSKQGKFLLFLMHFVRLYYSVAKYKQTKTGIS